MSRGGLSLGVLLLAAVGALVWWLWSGDPETPTPAPEATAPQATAPDTTRPDTATSETAAPETETSEAAQRETREPQPAASPEPRREAQPETAVSAPAAPQDPDPTAAPPQRSEAEPLSETQTAAVQPQRPAEEPTSESDDPGARADAGPSFDVVRVERDGSSVMAGRATPDSEVVVRKDGEEVARGRADSRGEFVLLPEQALPPGDYTLELEARTPEGELRRSRDVVVLSVPDAAERAPEAADEAAPDSAREGSLVVQLPADAAGEARVMQLPEPAPADAAGGLWLEAVDYDAGGRLVITGQGLPGARVLAYLDNSPLGEAPVRADGRWRLVPEREIAPGLYRLRVDQVDREGAVTARVESPFARAAFETADLPADERFVVIQPGNNLWTIARSTYGAGPRYTVIFEANADQIRDPDLIYPGQIFVLPESEGAG